MLRTVLMLLMLFYTAHAAPMNIAGYDSDVLRIYSKIVPRLVLLSSRQEGYEGPIDICVLHDPMDRPAAEAFSGMIRRAYPNGLKGHLVEVRPMTASAVSECGNSEILYLFQVSSDAFEHALEFAGRKHALTVAYHASMLERGADVSLHLGRKVIPYLNLASAERKGVEFDNLLIRVSKIYDEGEGDDE